MCLPSPLPPRRSPSRPHIFTPARSPAPTPSGPGRRRVSRRKNGGLVLDGTPVFLAASSKDSCPVENWIARAFGPRALIRYGRFFFCARSWHVRPPADASSPLPRPRSLASPRLASPRAAPALSARGSSLPPFSSPSPSLPISLSTPPPLLPRRPRSLGRPPALSWPPYQPRGRLGARPEGPVCSASRDAGVLAARPSSRVVQPHGAPPFARAQGWGGVVGSAALSLRACARAAAPPRVIAARRPCWGRVASRAARR